MENYDWDLSQPSTFAELPDEDFLAFLQKQFPPANATSVNPQNLNLAGSEESSPSPPELKRKADDEEFEPGPSKPASKKSAPTKRKSSGSVDESRLLKRKEQNRAAQRAFRERKEKHVKDLEDKVAALEAKNSQAQSENENLKDLLTRLQNENMALKQNSFTFTVPKLQSQSQLPQRQEQPLYPTNALDLSSLNNFDPSVLNLLEDQQTATAAGDSLAPNFGFSNATDQSGFLGNFRTIASNPMFTSLSTHFEEPGPATGVDFSALAEMSQKSQQGQLDIDFTSLTPWPGSTDDLFTATWGSPPSTTNISPIVHSSAPFSLTSSPGGIGLSDSITRSSFSSTSGSGSSSSSADSPSNLSDHPSSTTSMSSPPSLEQLHSSDKCPKTKGELTECIAAEGPSLFTQTPTHSTAPTPSIGEFNIAGLGGTLDTLPSGMRNTPSLNGSSAGGENPLGGGPGGVTCQKETSHFPSTEKSERNVEITTAWRSITNDPNHKAVDINLLCAEFSSKARCDGSKVVIKPEGLEDIKRLLSEKAALAMI